MKCAAPSLAFLARINSTSQRDTKILRARGNHVQFGDVGVSFGSFGTAVDLFFPNFSAGYSIPVARSGNGEAAIGASAATLNREQSLIVSPGRPVKLSYSANFETLTVQLDAKAVVRKLCGLLGTEVTTPLIFDPLFDFRRPTNTFWWRLICFLTSEAESRDDDIPLVARVETEQALLLMFLQSNSSNFSNLLHAKSHAIAPWQVLRAEEYIEANWDQPITVEALAAATN